MSDSRHVYPTTDEHITEGFDCWCSPAYMLPCDECGDTDGLAEIADDVGSDELHSDVEAMRAEVPGCWKCKNGLIELSREEAELAKEPLVIVHNR